MNDFALASRLPEPFPGIANFRDCGGYTSRFGGRIRREMLYRSGQLSDIQAQSLPGLLALDFTLIADLRYPVERRTEPSPWPQDWSPRVIFHTGAREGDEAPHLTLLRTQNADPKLFDEFYRDFYHDLPYDIHYAPLFGTVLKALSQCQGRALIHCSAGKDRTGLMVALLHHILGVSQADMVDNYMQTANSSLMDLVPGIIERIEARYGLRHSRDTVLALLAVDPSYLDISFHHIEKTSGSLDEYLNTIGVNTACRAALRARFIER